MINLENVENIIVKHFGDINESWTDEKSSVAYIGASYLHLNTEYDKFKNLEEDLKLNGFELVNVVFRCDQVTHLNFVVKTCI